MTSASLEGKAVIVTGAGRGIGREVARLLARLGASVVVNDLGVPVDGGASDDTPAHETVAAIEAEGGRAVANTDSVADWDGAQRIIGQATAAFGRLDGLVNNAGIIRVCPFEDSDPAMFDATVKVHLYGSYYMARAAAPLFKAQGSGAYVHMTSSTGLIGARNLSAYTAAKMGVVGLSRAIALDMAAYGVRSNAVAPAASTRMSPPRKTGDQDNVYKAEVKSEQIAPLAAFLLSDASASVNGQILGVRRNEIYLYNQSRPIRTLHRSDGWTLESLTEQMLPALSPSFTPLEETRDVFAWTAI